MSNKVYYVPYVLYEHNGVHEATIRDSSGYGIRNWEIPSRIVPIRTVHDVVREILLILNTISENVKLYDNRKSAGYWLATTQSTTDALVHTRKLIGVRFNGEQWELAGVIPI